MFGLRTWLVGLAAALLSAAAAHAQRPEIWFAPTNSVKGKPLDYADLYSRPERWRATAAGIAVFIIPSDHLFNMPEPAIRQELDTLRAHGIKIGINDSALPVDKKVCGDGVPGTIFAAEAPAHARKLKSLGVDVSYIMMDGPLTSGHTYTGKGACKMSLEDTARAVSIYITALHAAYPNARFIDDEPPTSMPLPEWQATLPTWLALVKKYSGIGLYGMTMDIGWNGTAWVQPVSVTAALLHKNGIRAGIYLDTIGNGPHNAQEWVTYAKHNNCTLQQTRIPVDYAVITNWNLDAVKNLPETDPTTLSGFTNWVVSGGKC
jgi:hypothetical protein